MKLIVLAVALMGCNRPLEPGETRCTSVPIGNGFSTTRCKTGQAAGPPAAPPPPAQTAGFWCATSSTFGACFPVPGGCEKYRMIIAEQCAAGSGSGACPTMSACFKQQYAMCATSGCFVDPASCDLAEKQLGRDGKACRARQ